MPFFPDIPDPPEYLRAVQSADLVRYTDVSQAPWFFARLARAFGGRYSDVNARLDPDDGTTIRWYGNYYNLPLGHWLYDGTTAIAPERLDQSLLRPVDRHWPFPIDPIPANPDTPTE